MTRLWIGALLLAGCTLIERPEDTGTNLPDPTNTTVQNPMDDCTPTQDTAPLEPEEPGVMGMWRGSCAWFEIDGQLPNGVPEFNLALTGEEDDLAGFGTFASTNADAVRTIVGFEATGALVGTDIAMDLVLSNDVLITIDGMFDEAGFDVVGSTELQGDPIDLYRCTMRPT